MFGTLQIEMSPVKNRGIINFKARFQMMDATENERLLLSLELMENWYEHINNNLFPETEWIRQCWFLY